VQGSTVQISCGPDFQYALKVESTPALTCVQPQTAPTLIPPPPSTSPHLCYYSSPNPPLHTPSPTQVQLSNGLPARVSAIEGDEITLDLNHELAGQHLTFDVTLQSLVPSEALQRATFGAGCFWG
jgi:hypothetical protein